MPLVAYSCALQSFYEYGDLFSETWRAFSENDIIHLKTYDSKRVGLLSVLCCHSRLSQRSIFCFPQVCFRDTFFSLLPRMRYGLFYNTPLVSYFWQVHVGLRANLQAPLLTPDPSRVFANCQVSKFQCTSHCNSGFSISSHFLGQICFLIFPAHTLFINMPFSLDAPESTTVAYLI